MSTELALYVGRDYRRRAHLSCKLESVGWVLHKARDVAMAMKKVVKYRYDLVLVHFDSVGHAAFSFCRATRSNNRGVILMVLMDKFRANVEEKLFDCLVHDVVVAQQVSSQVLIKRIRTRLQNGRLGWSRRNRFKLKDTLVDLDRREVCREGIVRQLPGILADLLKYFLDNPERVISRKELSQSYIWADSVCTPADQGGRTFDVNVSKLRKIIEPDPSRPQIIKSVRGIGWKLAVRYVP